MPASVAQHLKCVHTVWWN